MTGCSVPFSRTLSFTLRCAWAFIHASKTQNKMAVILFICLSSKHVILHKKEGKPCVLRSFLLSCNRKVKPCPVLSWLLPSLFRTGQILLQSGRYGSCRFLAGRFR